MFSRECLILLWVRQHLLLCTHGRVLHLKIIYHTAHHVLNNDWCCLIEKDTTRVCWKTPSSIIFYLLPPILSTLTHATISLSLLSPILDTPILSYPNCLVQYRMSTCVFLSTTTLTTITSVLKTLFSLLLLSGVMGQEIGECHHPLFPLCLNTSPLVVSFSSNQNKRVFRGLCSNYDGYNCV